MFFFLLFSFFGPYPGVGEHTRRHILSDRYNNNIIKVKKDEKSNYFLPCQIWVSIRSDAKSLGSKAEIVEKKYYHYQLAFLWFLNSKFKKKIFFFQFALFNDVFVPESSTFEFQMLLYSKKKEIKENTSFNNNNDKNTLNLNAIIM